MTFLVEKNDIFRVGLQGHRLEDLVAEIFSRKTGLKVYPVRKMFRHPLHPFMLADVDFFIDFPDGTKGILWI